MSDRVFLKSSYRIKSTSKTKLPLTNRDGSSSYREKKVTPGSTLTGKKLFFEGSGKGLWASTECSGDLKSKFFRHSNYRESTDSEGTKKNLKKLTEKQLWTDRLYRTQATNFPEKGSKVEIPVIDDGSFVKKIDLDQAEKTASTSQQ